MKVFFVHLMKTGGVSVKKFLSERFEDHYECFTLSENSFLTNQQVLEVYRHKKYNKYSDHKLSFVSTHGLDCLTFCVIRHPIDRYISIYNYNNQFGDFFKNDFYGSLLYTFIERNMHIKASSQMFHLGEGFGFNYIKDRIENGNCLAIPFDYIHDVVKIFGGTRLPRENTSNKIITKNSIINDMVKPFVQDDMFLYNYILDYYKTNREKILNGKLYKILV